MNEKPSVLVAVDGDSIARLARELVYSRFLKRHEYELHVVADRLLSVPVGAAFELVAIGSDASDHLLLAVLANRGAKAGILITRDLRLMQQALALNVQCLNDFGIGFSEQTINERRSIGEFHAEARFANLLAEKSKTYSEKDKMRFANGFDRVLSACLAGRNSGLQQ